MIENIKDVPPDMGGIYAIINRVNGKCYIGSSNVIRKRLNSHRRQLETGKHPNIILQSSWNKYGESSFIFDIFEPILNRELLLQREQFWFDTIKPSFNILKFASGRKGHKQSKETIERRMASIRGKPQSEESKRRKSEAQKGRKFSQQHIENMKIGFKTRPTAPYAKVNYVVTTPTGETLAVKNLTEFCKKHDLNRPHMVAVAKGRRKSHKGWLCHYDRPKPEPTIH